MLLLRRWSLVAPNSYIINHGVGRWQIVSLSLKMFVAQLVNTAFIVLLINGNLDYFNATAGPAEAVNTPLRSYWTVFQGAYNDFSEQWYSQVRLP